MNLWSAPIRVAAELAPAVWTFAAAEHKKDNPVRLVSARAIEVTDATDPTGTALGDDIRAFRRTAKLPLDASVILWPLASDEGVAPIASRPTVPLSVPKAKVLRERIAGLVRAGGVATGVWLPHECFVALARSRGESRACVIVAHAGMTCVGLVTDGAVRARYLSSAVPPATFDTESQRLLARYQHIAALAPHVRELGGATAGVRVLVAGRVPELRAAMVPLVEELDHEIDVLDGDLAGAPGPALDASSPDEIAGLQLAWTLAATPPGK